MQFHIENMTCSGCVRGVTSALKSVDPDIVVNADLSNRMVSVETSEAPDTLVLALKDAGFEARYSAAVDNSATAST